MERKKRHLRLRSIIVTLGDFVQHFDYDNNEKLKCSKEEKKERIKNIKIRLENKYLQNRASTAYKQTRSGKQSILSNKRKNKKNVKNSKILRDNDDYLFIDFANIEQSKTNQNNCKVSRSFAPNIKEQLENSQIMKNQSKSTLSNNNILDSLYPKYISSMNNDIFFSNDDFDFSFQNDDDLYTFF